MAKRILTPEQIEKNRVRAAAWAKENAERNRARSAAWRAANPERHKANCSAHYAANRETRRVYGKEYEIKNGERLRAKRRATRTANIEKYRDVAIKKSQAYRIKYPEKIAAYNKHWKANNPGAHAVYASRRRARKASAEGFHCVTDVMAIYRAQRGRCCYCRIPIRKKYHVDHIVALSKGGSDWPKNLQLTCVPCNLKKHTADPVDFAKRLGLLI